MVPFLQFKKREKHPWSSFTFSFTLIKVTLLHGCFSCFLNCTNGTKSRKVADLKNWKTLCYNFIAVLEFTLKFEHFENRKWASFLKFFWNYWLQKEWLLKCVKNPISEKVSAVNALMIAKNYWNLQKSTFILLFYYSEPSCVRKSYS